MKNIYHYDNEFISNPKRYNDLLLYQIGERYCNTTTVVEDHLHQDWYEITYIADGKGLIFTNNISAEVQKGDCYLSFPGDIHRIVSDRYSPLKYYYLAFQFQEGNVLRSALQQLQNTHRSATLRNVNDLLTGKLLGQALGELSNPSMFSSELIEYLVKELLIRLIRLYNNIESAEHLSPDVDRAQLICFSITNYIDNHLYTIQNLNELSAIFNYNYSYLSRLYKTMTGESISGYYQNAKLDFARQLIEQDEKSVTDIAEMLGYSSIYVFSRAFKNKFGVSPKTYRARTEREGDPGKDEVPEGHPGGTEGE